MPSNHFILYCLLVLMPSVFPSIRVFSYESLLCIRWPNYWSFSMCPPHEYLGLISLGLAGLIFLLSKGLSRVSLLSKGLSSFLDVSSFLAVQGTLKSFQHHSLKASILQCSAFFMVQLSYPCMITGKTIALTRQPRDLEAVLKELKIVNPKNSGLYKK